MTDDRKSNTRARLRELWIRFKAARLAHKIEVEQMWLASIMDTIARSRFGYKDWADMIEQERTRFRGPN